MTRTVLHVVDRTTGGVPVAARSLIEATPSGIDHVVLTPMTDGKLPTPWVGLRNASFHELESTSPLHAIRRVREVVSHVCPDVVHAHSSFPGAYVRIVVSRSRAKIVYSPHCFAFERRDISGPARGAFKIIETVLGANTTTLAACGPGEATIATRIPTIRQRVHLVPNTPSVVGGGARSTRAGASSTLRVAMLGRLSPQKDPAFFASVVAHLRAEIPGASATWIGDGDRTLLDDPLISITGWADAGEVAKQLQATDVYIHSAQWEGFPIALLDAHACDAPILARRIRALEGLPSELTVEGGIDTLIGAIQRNTYDEWRTANIEKWAHYLRPFTSENQTKSLALLWGEEQRS